MTFREFLKEICGLSDSSSEQAIRTILTIKNRIGDPDDLVSGPEKMEEALTGIEMEWTVRTGDRKNPLREYYCYKNGHWFDEWRPRNLWTGAEIPIYAGAEAQVTVREPQEKGPVVKDCGIARFTEELGSIRIRPCYYKGERDIHCDVRYEEAIPENERIDGLTDFINAELGVIVPYLKRMTEMDVFSPNCIRVILSSRKKTKRYGRKTDSGDLRRLIEKYEMEGINAVPTEELRDFLNGGGFTDIIAGEYDGHANIPTIYIYYRVLDSKSTEAYLGNVRKTLSHEVFHAAHHINAWRTFFDRSSTAERVKEALADFFSLLYCVDRETNIWNEFIYSESVKIAGERHSKWKGRFNSVWPYAYGLYFMLINRKELSFSKNINDYWGFGSIDKLNEVFRLSIESMERAYDCLTWDGIRRKLTFHGSGTGSVPMSLTGDEAAFSTGKMNMIAFPKTMFDGKKYSEEELEDFFYLESVNKRESLAPIYIKEILLNNKGRDVSVTQVSRALHDYPYEIEIKPNAVRRILNTIQANDDNVYLIINGHDFVYRYSESQPEGYVTIDDFDV